ncbi:50S ribosomal protein L29 [Thermodesulfobacteriota bacterium]
MKVKDIREQNIDELKLQEKDLREKLFNLKFQLSTNQLADTAELKQVRKDIARVKTIIKEKQLQR